MTSWLTFLIIGLAGGIIAGLFGIGGGVVIVPMLIYWAGFSQHKATGTSLALLLLPIGLAGAIEFYRHGNVDLRAGLIIASTMFAGAWFGAYIANKMRGPYLRLAFGIFVVCMGIYLIYGACKRLGWVRSAGEKVVTIVPPDNRIDIKDDFSEISPPADIDYTTFPNSK